MGVLSSGRSAGLSQSRRLTAQLAPRSLTFEEALQRFGLVHHLHGPPARCVRSGRSPATAWPGGAALPARPARQSRLGSRYSPARLSSRSLPAALARPPPAPRPARRPQRPLPVRPEPQPRVAGHSVACRGRSTWQWGPGYCLALKSVGSVAFHSSGIGRVPDYESDGFQN